MNYITEIYGDDLQTTVVMDGQVDTKDANALEFANDGDVSFFVNQRRVTPGKTFSINYLDPAAKMRTRWIIRFSLTDPFTTGTNKLCIVTATYFTITQKPVSDVSNSCG